MRIELYEGDNMKISVIVPVYNAERCLKKCITSVTKQTYSNWELILVDDGSKDRSADIIDMAEKKDCRIVAIHQQNSGPGIARNRGIEIATGDYVVFLDSDDFIDEDYFELLVLRAQQRDVVFIDVEQIAQSGKVLSREKMSEYKTWSKEKILRSQMTGKIPWGGVRKAVKLELLTEYNIRFTSHSIGEEALYSFCVLYAAETIGFIDEKPVYFYVNHDNSQSKIQMADPWGEVALHLKDYLKEQNIYQKYADTMNAFLFTALVVSLDKIDQIYKGSKKIEVVKERLMNFYKVYDKNVGIDRKSMSYKAKIFVPFLKHGIYWPVLLVSRLKRLL